MSAGRNAREGVWGNKLRKGGFCLTRDDSQGRVVLIRVSPKGVQMNSTTKRLQAHAAHAQADYYKEEAQAYCTIRGRHASDRADALRLAARSLQLQANALRSVEATCAH